MVTQSNALPRAGVFDRDLCDEWFSGVGQHVLRDSVLAASRVLPGGDRFVIVGESGTVVPLVGVAAVFRDHESGVADRVCKVFEWRELYTLGAEPRAAVENHPQITQI